MHILHISHPGRALYEDEWLLGAAGDSGLLTILPAGESAITKGEARTLTTRQARLNNWLGSTATLTKYVGLIEAIQAEIPDVIITIEAFSTTTQQALDAARLVQRPHVAIVYELLAHHPIYQIPPFRSIARNAAMNSKFVCVTRAAANHLLVRDVPANRIEVVYPGVDTDLFVPRIVKSDEGGIIFVGRLAEHKGIREITAAYAAVLSDHPRTRLTVVGDGPLRSEIESFANRHQYVRYVGPLSPTEVAYELSQHDIFVLPAKNAYRFKKHIWAEQFGFSVVEAMAAGLAIIVTDCGALPEVVSGNNPIIRQGNTEDLIVSLRSLLSGGHQLRELQHQNRQRAENSFALGTQAAKLREVLQM